MEDQVHQDKGLLWRRLMLVYTAWKAPIFVIGAAALAWLWAATHGFRAFNWAVMFGLGGFGLLMKVYEHLLEPSIPRSRPAWAVFPVDDEEDVWALFPRRWQAVLTCRWVPGLRFAFEADQDEEEVEPTA